MPDPLELLGANGWSYRNDDVNVFEIPPQIILSVVLK